jgi:hypothetical protein
MGIDFSTLVYLPGYDVFARDVSISPVVSQPTATAYTARGVYSTRELDVAAEDGSIVQDQQTILDVRDAEFGVVPMQGDHVTIPADGNNPALGDFEIINAVVDGGGETTLTLRKILSAP